MKRLGFILWLVFVTGGFMLLSIVFDACVSEDINVNPSLPIYDDIVESNEEPQSQISLTEGETNVVYDKPFGLSFVVPSVMKALHLDGQADQSRWLIQLQYEPGEKYAQEFYQMEPEVLMTNYSFDNESDAIDFIDSRCESDELKIVQGKVFKVCYFPGMVPQVDWFYQETNFVYMILLKSYPTMFGDQEIKQMVDDSIEELVFSVNINQEGQGESK
ncbi:hypothetical protein COT97_04430 [Candidatus Falkowbacteria bacterium CG10_big_fil_rev_8_21_14_0_10_39_11]|uniref:Uncharacterized protein n=1 Tax=Candidatus Falkowbacteria bacterium CG10_big_fil_rev_8_21_14_0_10_39_11 TaxID=1974565 RepID=A0A2H0V437_9BACT|nr:MAG: hypothetical protein COT97_04430 [Candidatus Falkowbacteria bacterium CG10_big_fil_rev_8_21_14_0_10_39_11]